MPDCKPVSRSTRGNLATLLVAFMAACGPTTEASNALPASSADDPLAAIVEQNLTALATQCQFNATTGVMTVAVATGETAIISKRAADSAIVQNGYGCNNPATASTVKKITSTRTPLNRTVICRFTKRVLS